jgi:hypothetical protein
MAINTSSGTPLYLSSANTDGNVSKLHEEVLIFSMMSAVGSFARTMVRMSAFFSVVKLSWAKANETQERERATARRTDDRDLDMGDPFKSIELLVRAQLVEGLEVRLAPPVIGRVKHETKHSYAPAMQSNERAGWICEVFQMLEYAALRASEQVK